MFKRKLFRSYARHLTLEDKGAIWLELKNMKME